MLQVNNLIGFGAFALVETIVDRTTGTNIGNMTGGGGLTAIFDGDTDQGQDGGGGTSAFKEGATGYAGKTYGAAKIYSKVVVYGSNDHGYVRNTNPTVTLTLYGKNGTPANATDGTSIGSLTFTDTSNENVGRTITSTDQGNSYTSVWVNCTSADTTQSHGFAELQIYELL